jgi:hypothetical protein
LIFIIARLCFDRRLFFITTPRRDSAVVVVFETRRCCLSICYSRPAVDWIEIDSVAIDRCPCALFCFDRIGVALHRSDSAKSSTSARRSSFAPEPRGHAEPSELPCVGRRVLKKSSGALFLSYSGDGCSRSCPALGGGCWSPRDTCRPRSCPEPVTHDAPGADLRRVVGAAPGAVPSWSIIASFR